MSSARLLLNSNYDVVARYWEENGTNKLEFIDTSIPDRIACYGVVVPKGWHSLPARYIYPDHPEFPEAFYEIHSRGGMSKRGFFWINEEDEGLYMEDALNEHVDAIVSSILGSNEH